MPFPLGIDASLFWAVVGLCWRGPLPPPTPPPSRPTSPTPGLPFHISGAQFGLRPVPVELGRVCASYRLCGRSERKRGVPLKCYRFGNVSPPLGSITVPWSVLWELAVLPGRPRAKIFLVTAHRRTGQCGPAESENCHDSSTRASTNPNSTPQFPTALCLP